MHSFLASKHTRRLQVSLRHFQSYNSNDLLDYLKGLDTNALSQLTACAGDDIIEAMNAFIHRLLGSSDEEDLRRAPSQSNAVELARLLFWYDPTLKGHCSLLITCASSASSGLCFLVAYSDAAVVQVDVCRVWSEDSRGETHMLRAYQYLA